MSHSGNFRYRNLDRRLTETGFSETRKLVREEEDITKIAKLDEQKLEGEFRGNGTTVLIGLSTSQELDIDNILKDNEKGIIIGYTPDSAYFQIFRNDATGSKVVTNLDNRIKDTNYHKFNITVASGNKVLINFDGAHDTITTKIPSITDSLYIVNYGVY